MEDIKKYLTMFINAEKYDDRMVIKTEALKNLDIAQSLLFLNMCLDFILAKVGTHR
jgi:hypothetical protein